MLFLYIEPIPDKIQLANEQLKDTVNIMLEQYGYQIKSVMDLRAVKVFARSVEKIM